MMTSAQVVETSVNVTTNSLLKTAFTRTIIIYRLMIWLQGSNHLQFCKILDLSQVDQAHDRTIRGKRTSWCLNTQSCCVTIRFSITKICMGTQRLKWWLLVRLGLNLVFSECVLIWGRTFKPSSRWYVWSPCSRKHIYNIDLMVTTTLLSSRFQLFCPCNLITDVFELW